MTAHVRRLTWWRDVIIGFSSWREAEAGADWLSMNAQKTTASSGAIQRPAAVILHVYDTSGLELS